MHNIMVTVDAPNYLCSSVISEKLSGSTHVLCVLSESMYMHAYLSRLSLIDATLGWHTSVYHVKYTTKTRSCCDLLTMNRSTCPLILHDYIISHLYIMISMKIFT